MWTGNKADSVFVSFPFTQRQHAAAATRFQNVLPHCVSHAVVRFWFCIFFMKRAAVCHFHVVLWMTAVHTIEFEVYEVLFFHWCYRSEAFSGNSGIKLDCTVSGAVKRVPSGSSSRKLLCGVIRFYWCWEGGARCLLLLHLGIRLHGSLQIAVWMMLNLLHVIKATYVHTYTHTHAVTTWIIRKPSVASFYVASFFFTILCNCSTAIIICS